jgi:hypothetical protein
LNALSNGISPSPRSLALVSAVPKAGRRPPKRMLAEEIPDAIDLETADGVNRAIQAKML